MPCLPLHPHPLAIQPGGSTTSGSTLSVLSFIMTHLQLLPAPSVFWKCLLAHSLHPHPLAICKVSLPLKATLCVLIFTKTSLQNITSIFCNAFLPTPHHSKSLCHPTRWLHPLQDPHYLYQPSSRQAYDCYKHLWSSVMTICLTSLPPFTHLAIQPDGFIPFRIHIVCVNLHQDKSAIVTFIFDLL